MTKGAVKRAYQDILERLAQEMLDVVEEKLGGGLLGRTAKAGAKSVVEDIQDEMETQGRIVVEYAAALSEGDDVERYRREFLRTNPVYQRYDGDDEEGLAEDLLDHFDEVGRDLAPLVASDADDFWVALLDEYTREEAEDIIDRQFTQAETFKRYKSGIFRSETMADEVIAVIDEGETRLQERLDEELERANT